MADLVWSSKKKWMGNLIPLVCMLPFAVAGAFLLIKAQDITVAGVGLCLAALIIGWLAVNQFGFFGNAALRRDIQRKVLAKAGKDASKGIFVGFARPSYVGVIDAHEDLGFLFIGKEGLEYIGELHHVTVSRGDVLGVRYRANIHSTIGLGRWVSIDAKHEGKNVRILVEPREAATLLGNKRRGTELKKQISDWRKGS